MRPGLGFLFVFGYVLFSVFWGEGGLGGGGGQEGGSAVVMTQRL